MSDKDGAEKNWERVVDGVDAMRDEWSEQTTKVLAAFGEKDYIGVVHHATGYLEAAIQHPYKLWFYTWPLKWGLVLWLLLG
jgi:hypothetical protein